MKKYLMIVQTTLKEYAAYRLNFLLWRVRTLLNLLIIIFIWEASFNQNNPDPNLIFKKDYFLSYFIYAITISYLILGTTTTDIAFQINSGGIINLLLKPVSFFKYYFFKDLTDKAINLFFAIIEAILVIYFLKINLIFPKNLFLGSVFLVNGVFISFFINLLLSFIGFWSREVWAPRFLFIIIVSFVSGSFFPLDILPKIIYQFLLLTPFPYLYYLPTKIFLGGEINLMFAISSFFWVFAFYYLTKKIFIKGLKNFSYWGR